MCLKKKIICSFLYLMIISLVIFFYGPNTSYKEMCALVVIDIIICLYYIYTENCLKLIDARFLFVITTIFFTFGEDICYFFFENSLTEGMKRICFYRYGENIVKIGSQFTVLAFNFFILGLFYKTNLKIIIPGIKIKEKYKKYYIDAAHWIGRIMVILSFIPEIIYLSAEISLFFTSGYGNTALENLPGIVIRYQYMFIPGMIILLLAKNQKKEKIRFIVLTLISLSIIYLSMGDRGKGLAIFVVLFWIKIINSKKIKLKKYIFIAIIIFLLIPLVKFYRIAYTLNIFSPFSYAVEQMFIENPIIDILLELGGTQEILILTMEKVRVEGIAYGKAYLDFFIEMLPGFFGIQRNYITLAKWLISTTGYQTIGFSIWGEAYLNFKYLGIPFMFFLGFLFNKLLNSEKKNILKIILTANTLYFFIDISRRSLGGFGYNFLYNILLPVFIIYLLGEYFGKKSNERQQNES